MARTSLAEHFHIRSGHASTETVAAIVRILQESKRVRSTTTDVEFEIRNLAQLLGVSQEAARMAVNLTYTKGGHARGTEHHPNARHGEFGNEGGPQVDKAVEREIYTRAAYLANAATRLQRSLDAGDDDAEAATREAVYYRQHEKARKARLEAAAQVEWAGRMYGWQDERGTLVGWYLDLTLNNDRECIEATGNNFYVEEGTVIGLPGSVHPGCGCYAGPPWEEEGLVNDVLAKVTFIDKAKYRLKRRK